MTAALLLSVMVCFTACGEKKSATAEDATASNVPKLQMATNPNFPPYEFVEDGAYAGIDVEIADAIADYLDMELVINDVEFGSIIGGVQSGKFDMGMAGMTVTEERKQSVNFSDTYATGVQVIIVKEGSPIQTVDDLKDKKIGVQQDTTGDIYATDDFGKENVTSYKNGADAVQALVSDKVEAVIIDNEPAKSFVAANKGLTILPTEYVVEEYAIAIAKDNTDLLNIINEALKVLTENGTIENIIRKYIPAEAE